MEGQDRPLDWVPTEERKHIERRQGGWWFNAATFVAPPGASHTLAEVLQLAALERQIELALRPQLSNAQRRKLRGQLEWAAQAEMEQVLGIAKGKISLILRGHVWPTLTELFGMLWYLDLFAVPAPWRGHVGLETDRTRLPERPWTWQDREAAVRPDWSWPETMTKNQSADADLYDEP